MKNTFDNDEYIKNPTEVVKKTCSLDFLTTRNLEINQFIG